MIMYEIQEDLFKIPRDYYYVHCISGDYALGKGIAKKFDDVYNMRFKLFRDYPIPAGKTFGDIGKALLVDNVFNLVTKGRYYHKPTYNTLQDALIDLRKKTHIFNIKKIAMPRIGCGLDRLQWDNVKELIQNTFIDDDIEILVCVL